MKRILGIFLVVTLLATASPVFAGTLRADFRELRSFPTGKTPASRVINLTLGLIRRDPDRAEQYLRAAARKLAHNTPASVKWNFAQRAADTLAEVRPIDEPVPERDIVAVETLLWTMSNSSAASLVVSSGVYELTDIGMAEFRVIDGSELSVGYLGGGGYISAPTSGIGAGLIFPGYSANSELSLADQTIDLSSSSFLNTWWLTNYTGGVVWNVNASPTGFTNPSID